MKKMNACPASAANNRQAAMLELQISHNLASFPVALYIL